jgi:hypothetical protein
MVLDSYQVNMKSVAFLVDIILFGFFYLSNNLNRDLAYFLIGIGILIFLWDIFDRRLITYREARLLAKNEIKNMQKHGDIPAGTMWILPETELKEIITKKKGGSSIDPFKWEVGVGVAGEKNRGYLVRISKWGSILGTSEMRMPMSYRVTDTESLIEISAEDNTDEQLPKRDRKRALDDQETEDEGAVDD